MAVGLVAVSVNWTRLPSSSSILSPQYTTLPFNLREPSGSSENFSPRSARISAIFALQISKQSGCAVIPGLVRPQSCSFSLDSFCRLRVCGPLLSGKIAGDKSMGMIGRASRKFIWVEGAYDNLSLLNPKPNLCLGRAGSVQGLPGFLRLQTTPASGPEACTCYLHWAIWSFCAQQSYIGSVFQVIITTIGAPCRIQDLGSEAHLQIKSQFRI